MTQQQKKIGIVAGILLAAWLALFFSNKGLLVWSDKPDGDAKVGMMKCHYFTGTGTVEKQFLFSEQGFLGRQACPRTVDLK
ncbi:MAG: YobH family protein [Gammaproteobacteria bacterium]